MRGSGQQHGDQRRHHHRTNIIPGISEDTPLFQITTTGYVAVRVSYLVSTVNYHDY